MCDVASLDPAEIIGGLQRLIGREGVSEDYVRFRIELFEAQTAVLDALRRSVPPSASGTTAATTGQEVAALEPDEVAFDDALLGKLLENLSAAMRRRGHPSDDLARLSAAAGVNSDLLTGFARGAAIGPDEALLVSLSTRFGVSFDALLFVGRVLAAPFVTEAVRRREQRGTAPPNPTGCCPFCGSPPGLARLDREQGTRILCCSLCGQTWPLARLRCPFCAAQRELGVLRVEDDDPCWIETCNACENYLKTVDQRRLPEGRAVVPLVETTATVYLDLIAEKQRYRRSTPYAALR